MSNGEKAPLTYHPHPIRNVDLAADLDSMRITYFQNESYIHNIYIKKTDGSEINLGALSSYGTGPEGRSETLNLKGQRIIGVEMHNFILADGREDFVSATLYLAF